ncbi:MAG: 50S ribosomal protein L30 [Spirosomataceae bacterium]
MATVKITQIKSTIDRPKNQKLTIQALGLGKINKSVVKEVNAPIAGMIRKVQHLIVVEEI